MLNSSPRPALLSAGLGWSQAIPRGQSLPECPRAPVELAAWAAWAPGSPGVPPCWTGFSPHLPWSMVGGNCMWLDARRVPEALSGGVVDM